MRGADPPVTFLDLDGERDTVMQTEPAPRAAHTALHRPQRLPIRMPAFETRIDQLFPDRWQIAHMRPEQIDPLSARDLRIQVVFLGYLPQHDQLLRRDLTPGDARDYRIAAAFLDIGQITVIAILDGRLLGDRLVP